MEKKYIQGLFTNRRENAPDFVVANLSFKTEQFIEWLKEHTNAKGYCNVDVLKGQDGSVYSKHNDWKPEERLIKTPEGRLSVEERVNSDTIDTEFGTMNVNDIPNDEINVENIPFNKNLSKF